MMMNLFSKSLKNKLIFSHTVTVAAVVLFIAAIIYFISVSMQITAARSFDQQIVDQISGSLKDMIVSFKRINNYVSMNKDLQRLLKEDNSASPDRQNLYELNDKLQSIAVEQTLSVNEIHSLYLYDTQALRVYFKRHYESGEQEKFLATVERERFAADGNIKVAVNDGMVSFNRSIRDLNTLEIIGYLTVIMDKNYIQEKINTLRSNPNRFLIVTDEKGNVIVHNYEKADKLDDILGSIKDSTRGSRLQRVDTIGLSLITAETSDYSGWKTISVISLGEIVKQPKVIAKWIFFIGLLGVAFGVSISLFSSAKLVKPIKDLTYLAGQVENENFDVRVKTVSRDELGRLSRSFNKMVDKIDCLIKEVYQEELKLKEAELKALQAQINPHFLYNTLDCINWLAEFGRIDDIRSVTISLANLMKASANNGKKTITIRDELEYIKAYLLIYKISLEDKLSYYLDIDEDILDCYIPKLILQPLVENAIIHGLKQKLEPGNLHIKGFIQKNSLLFQIFDDGVGMSKEEIERYVNGVYQPYEAEASGKQGTQSGLRNVIERVRLMYGGDYGLSVESQIGVGTMMELRIGIKESEEY